MYIVEANKWKPELEIGQERLLVDAWLELVADDVSPLHGLPIYSGVQLLTNLAEILSRVDRQVLKPYHIVEAAEELLVRLNSGSWLEHLHRIEVVLLRQEIDLLRKSPNDSASRQRFASLLRAFLGKLRSNDPIRQQLRHLTDLTAEKSTSYAVIIRAAAELLNDLIHLGHSRGHLHGWLLRSVVGGTPDRRYLQRLRETRGLTEDAPRDFQVAFRVACPTTVQATPTIRFSADLPGDWQVPADSAFVAAGKSHIAIVDAPSCKDPLAAIELSRRVLRRYFVSTRLDHLEFDRSISAHAVARDVGSMQMFTDDGVRRLEQRRLHNDDVFYRLPEGKYNQQTFSEFDRIIFWLEQSRLAEEMGSLIAQWTALEFLCSTPGKTASESIADLTPVYVVPQMPRMLLLDFWRALLHIGADFSAELTARLHVSVSVKSGRPRKCDLVALFEACLEEEATNEIKPLIEPYPILVYKWRHIRQMNPCYMSRGSNHAVIWDEVSALERDLVFDLRSCYRVRNTIVHDAAIDVAQIDRLSQRLNWVLTLSLDTLLHQFSRNPALSLTDLHNNNRMSYVKWKEDLKDPSKPLPADLVVFPKTYFLS